MIVRTTNGVTNETTGYVNLFQVLGDILKPETEIEVCRNPKGCECTEKQGGEDQDRDHVRD